MSDKIRDEQIDVILTSLAAYYQTQLNVISIKIYHSALSAFPVDAIRQAAMEHIKISKFFPKASELIELMTISGPKVPLIEDTATVQAHHVLEVVRTRGQYFTDPRWADRVTDKLMHTRWNYYTLCDMNEDQSTWFVKEFVSAYLSLSRVEHNDANLKIEGPEKLKQLASGLFKSVDD